MLATSLLRRRIVHDFRFRKLVLCASLGRLAPLSRCYSPASGPRSPLRWVAPSPRSARPPAPTPLLTGFAADLTRSRTELLAEIALLRQQLIVASRRVKRARLPVTRTRPACAARWAGAPMARCCPAGEAGHRLALAPTGVSPFLALQVAQAWQAAPTSLPRCHRADSSHGQVQRYLGRRAHPRRVAQARHPRDQANHSEVRASSATTSATARPEVAHLPTQPYRLGFRLFADVRYLVPPDGMRSSSLTSTPRR